MSLLIEVLKTGYAELGAICFLLIRTWLLKRQIKWLKRLSELEAQRRISETNETWRIASTAFASGEPVTLEDLLNRREEDFRLK